MAHQDNHTTNMRSHDKRPSQMTQARPVASRPAAPARPQPTRTAQQGRPAYRAAQQGRPAYRAAQSTAKRTRTRKTRRWPWVVAIMVVIALWIPVIGWFTGLLPVPGSQTETAPEAQTEAVIDPTADTKAIEAIAQQGEELIAQLEQEDLSWRDAEFAVDPNRDTAWTEEPNGRKVVYLTIDDGPSENTQAVLDILDKYNCKATFFVTGINPDYAYQIKEEYRRGHTVGLHTYSHDYAQIYSSTGAYFADLEAIGNVVKEQIGYVPCFIRFPGGSSNVVSASYSVGIMSTLVNEVNAAGYQYYDWNASSGDGSEHTADELYGYACEFDDLENVVLLCHDSATKQTTVEALPRIIEHYQGLGYTFEAIDRTTMVPHHGVNN